MILSRPKFQENGKFITASADFQPNGGPRQSLWFELHSRYKDYVVTERCDAFLLGLLPYAMLHGEDIHLDCPVSEKLYYQLSDYLIPALTLANPAFRRMRIVPGQLEHHSLNSARAVGTGFSGGVDSFCTVHDHFVNLLCPPSYRLTHLTFFNVGSHGDLGGETARTLFRKRLNLLGHFPKECGLELVVVDSNLSEVLQMNFSETHTLRNMAPVLLLQNLFHVYYYSSAYRMDDFRLINTSSDTSPYDLLNLAMLSTESISLYSAGTQYTRVEKTALIADYEPTWRYLNVCVCDDLNCSSCFKCMRTLLTLELIGKLNNFSSIFNIDTYFRHRDKYIGEVLSKKHRYLYKDIYHEMVKINFRIPMHSRGFALLMQLRSLCE